jgi:hypothetical protein
MRHAPWVWITALAALCGVPFMLGVIVLGAGDTSVGNSSSAFDVADATLIGIPILLGLSAYMAARQSDLNRVRAFAVAVLVPPAIFAAVIGAFLLLVSLSSVSYA